MTNNKLFQLNVNGVIGRMVSAQKVAGEEIAQTLDSRQWKKGTEVFVKVIRHLLKNVTCKNVLVSNSKIKVVIRSLALLISIAFFKFFSLDQSSLHINYSKL